MLYSLSIIFARKSIALFLVFFNLGQESNFFRYADDVINTLGLDYDYESVMHYGNTYFSKNGRPTILATPNLEIVLGQRSGLSNMDYVKVNVLYDCSCKNTGNNKRADKWIEFLFICFL